MFAMPDAAELVELAASLNLRMSEKEAELYLPLIFDAMRDRDAFVQSRAEEAVVRDIAPLVQQDPTDPMAAIEANLRRNWILMPIAYDTKPTNYTGIRLLRRHRQSGWDADQPAVGGEFLADPLLLRVAYAYQRAVDWAAITGVE